MAATDEKKKKKKNSQRPGFNNPFSALEDEESFWGPNFLPKVGRGLKDWYEGEFGYRTAPDAATAPLEKASDLPSGGSADDTDQSVASAQKQIEILTDSSYYPEDRKKVARNLSDASYAVIRKAAANAGLDPEEVLASMDQLEPKSMNKVLLREKGLSATADINKPSEREVLVAAAREESKKKPAADTESYASNDAEYREPEMQPGKPQPKLGPGGKVAGTQEDFAAYRAQKAIDQAMSEKDRQAKIAFLRAGGRYAAKGFGTTVAGQQVSLDRPDGQRLAVLPGRGRTPADQRSGAYAYADELQDEARLAENARNRERQQNFVANLGEPATELGKNRERENTRRAEAEAFLTNIKRAARGADRTAREIARGYEQEQYGRRRSNNYDGGAADFFAEADQLGSVKAQLRGKDQEAQIKWARKQLDAREEARRDQERKEEERRRSMTQSSYKDLVEKYRNPSSSSFSTVNFGI